MEAVIANYRRGRRTQNMHQLILYTGKDKKQAKKLIGKTVSWQAPGKNKKVLKGKITSLHGNKGAVRALMETGIPGQALGQKVKIE
jgi:ribosomal protein L35AE/L33A